MAVYREIKVKSILNRTNIPGIDYTINPYVGCEHSCTYCYARFIYEIYDIDPSRWGEHVFIKINAVELLKSSLHKLRNKNILIGSSTDPYQPIEEKYRITRGILNALKRIRAHINILTKSNLVLRDLDIIKSLHTSVGMTIITLDSNISLSIERRAPKPYIRLSTLKKLHLSNINTYAFVAPIIPLITDKELEDIIIQLKNAGVKEIYFDKLNVKAKNWLTINASLDEIGIERRKFWKLVKSENYWSALKRRIQFLEDYYNFTARILFN